MKKEIYTLILSLLSYTFGFGQAFTGGITGGFSVNQMDGDGYKGYNMLGFTGGAYVQTNKSGKWQMQGEIKYFLKGAEQILPANASFYKVHLNYVQVPILLQYFLSEKLFPEIGIATGYMFWAREDKDGSGFVSPDKPYKKVEVSFEAGLNFQVTKSIRGNIRLSYSILPVHSFPGDQTYYFDRGEYNSSLSFNLYYRILPRAAHKK